MHSQAFQVLADPTRLQIVEVLRRGELPVNDIVARTAIHQSGVSRHLRILHGAGFVTMRPEGQQRLYALRAEPFRELEAWAASYRRMWEGRLDRLGEALAKRRGGRAPTAAPRRPTKTSRRSPPRKEEP